MGIGPPGLIHRLERGTALRRGAIEQRADTFDQGRRGIVIESFEVHREFPIRGAGIEIHGLVGVLGCHRIAGRLRHRAE